VLINCQFSGNTATQGGGVMIGDAYTAVVNCVFSGNRATSGGGVYTGGAPANFINCTWSGNVATTGAGLWATDTPVPRLTNCILWGNTGPVISSYVQTAPLLTYCDIEGGFTGTGNISSNPRFVRGLSAGPDGQWGTFDDDYGDLRLQAGSPCIDAGSNSAPLADMVTDLDGHGRFYNDPATPDCRWAPGTCGTAPIVDMGAYEFIAGDYDRDGDLDSADLAGFQACVSGPGVPYSGDCTKADLNHDGAVDLADFGLFQGCFSGAGKAVNPNCAR
jgi:predicted outer membrane repeat protein